MSKKRIQFVGITRIWSIVFAIIVGYTLFTVCSAGLLPWKYLAGASAGIVIMGVVLLFLLIRKKEKTWIRVIALFLSVVMTVGCGFANYAISHADRFLDRVTKEENVVTEQYAVIVPADSSYQELSEIADKTVSVLKSDSNSYQEARKALKTQVDVHLTELLELDEAVEVMVPAETENWNTWNTWDTASAEETEDEEKILYMYKPQYEAVIEDESYAEFAEKTKVLATIDVEVSSTVSAAGVDVTEDSFNIYISGIDVDGSIDVVSRTDVNMIVTVNPRTHKILITSIPRDTEIQLPTKNNATDKLTHSGLYGISETLGAMENLLQIEFNYYVKVNFSTVTALVDAIDGIDVESDYAFTSRVGGYYFQQGTNHLDGAMALAFARERYSFGSGDFQRTKNQAKVMEGIINKCTSSTTILTNYADILDSLGDYMRMNIPSSDIKSLVKMQIDEMPGWTFEQQGLEGEGKMSTCYSMGSSYVYIMEPNEDSITSVRDTILEFMEEEPEI